MKETRARLFWLGLRPVVVVLLVCAALMFAEAPDAAADVGSDASSAAQLATNAGYRTGIAVLNLSTGTYYGAGQDTAAFASESVAKVLIATELLLTGQMTGNTETMAYQMITQSDDDDADALYGLAGGDNVINLVEAHYNLPSLGTPPTESGFWGNTEITAKGLVYLYADIAKDSVVGPWLMNAMANATEYGADGTYQFFGIPAATTGAAIKQGWGDDGEDSPNAVFNSTGYVENESYAVAILTDGPPSSYGSAISAMVTTEAQTLFPGGKLNDPVAHNPVITGLTATAQGNTVKIMGNASDTDAAGSLSVTVREGASSVAVADTDANHAFDISFLAANGTHTYTVTVPNIGEGTSDTSLSTQALTVNGTPTGHVESVTGGSGAISITGREADPNLPSRQTPRVSVVITGSSSETISNPDVVPGVAAGTYTLTVPAKAGHDTVTVTYLGTDGAPNVIEGSWPVVVSADAAQRRAADLHVAAEALPGAPVLLVFGLGLALHRRKRRKSM